jgi:hypothetical protein
LVWTEGQHDDDQILARRLTSGEREVGEKVQGLMANSGMTGIEEERLRGDGSMEVRAGAAKL